MIDKNTSDGYHTFGELYEHRYMLFLHILRQNPERAWRSDLHDDGTMFDDSFIAGLETKNGQISYHLPNRLKSQFEQIKQLEKAPAWDGHNSDDVLVRLLWDTPEIPLCEECNASFKDQGKY